MATQTSLSKCESIIEKLKDQLKDSEHDRMRLNQFKVNKQQRLQELEEMVKKFDDGEHINMHKIVENLLLKERELTQLKNSQKTFEERLKFMGEQNEK